MALALLLARAQFAFTVGFHIVLPAFSIGLASYLAVLEALFLITGRGVYLDLFNYWLRIFAVVFAMGVVSGLVMSYEFGTNWSQFATKAGPVIGPLMGYEVLTAFFLEAGFLGVMLFGMARVGPGLHFTATCIVAIGTLISAFWILAVNSWMQTPAGFALAPDGRFLPADWWAIIFNPSFPYRLIHMVLASYLSVAFAVGAVGAHHLRRDRQSQAARTMFSMALWMAAIVAPIQVIAGDAHGLNTLRYQPAKIAAMEGDFRTVPGTALKLFGLPDMARGRTDDAIEIPHLGALILTHRWNGTVPGLDSFPRRDWPPAPWIFWSFRIMVALGFAMAGVGVWSLWARARGRLFDSRWLRRAALAMGPSGFIAVLAGWTTTEVGRQPYTVYGLLRTSHSASPIAAPGVAASFAAIAVVYLIVFGVGLRYILRQMRRAPEINERGPEAGVPVRSAGITPAPALGAPRLGASPPGRGGGLTP
ncbi:MAG: cytochrome ubiquinol oxidase subunit I [Rhodospirillales bacterium]|nr:cytochrome ubiquinol oxidase subunit I [Rhodospirillales bacterium]